MTFHFLKAGKTLVSGATLALIMSSTAFAIGGDDPIDGIDIIVKKNPASRKVQPGQFGAEQVGLTYNADVEKLNARLQDFVGQTLKMNDFAEDRNARAFMKGDAIASMSKDLSAQISEGHAGQSSFTFPSADGESKMTVTISIRGDAGTGEAHPEKAISYGSTRSNTKE
ncbi:hypothetical protein GCM10011309_09380 [Litorimonas cladophorae]|uniref:Uncharacterized protein n=1 Tax=Litorimonas cladophorae TaxID=1220491 RepID=A0A918KF54_9PROT|nr:hypothetical protein [Litorimonas cladophorae]GGX61552.1 hypothetical protein GCM10011309_09380 [Litorimonas cladophorae]